jgi:hypothetical protein
VLQSFAQEVFREPPRPDVRLTWTKLHRRRLAPLKFDRAVHHLRRDRLTAQIATILPDWTLAPVVGCCR